MPGKRGNLVLVSMVLICGLWSADQLSAQAHVSFIARRDFALSGAPSAIAMGDFNGDEIMDLVVTNRPNGNPRIPGQVSILLGNGDGTFRLVGSFRAGFSPNSIAVGDFDGDGRLDLALPDTGTLALGTTVAIVLGNGDGTFGPPRSFAAGRQPGAVAVGDFNGDAIADLAVANSGTILSWGTTVSILLGNGDGTFGTPTNVDVGRQPMAVVVADFNDDGIADLATTHYSSGNVAVLLGNGDGTFGKAQFYAVDFLSNSLAVGDFNGDGIPDLAATEGIAKVAVLLGNGNGTFRPAAHYDAGYFSKFVIVGDFNGDGTDDLAVVNSGAHNVAVLLSNGDGTFAMARYFGTGVSSGAAAVDDFDGDGRLDLAVTNASSLDVSILMNDTE